LLETDYDSFVIALLDKNDNDVFRLDADELEIKSFFELDQNDKFIHIWREFESSERPHSWRVWPHSKSKGWCERIQNPIGYE
jgi:hypothetical protein